VTWRGQTRVYDAREAEGEEREEYWQRAVSLYAGYAAYAKRVGPRHIPVMVLTPVDEVDILLQHLSQTVFLLRAYQRTHWADWLQRDYDEIARGDFRGIQHLLGAFGGMGSLNDVMIHPLNGDQVTEEEGAEITATLHQLLRDIYVLATSIRRDYER
jgi:hypothetical protein